MVVSDAWCSAYVSRSVALCSVGSADWQARPQRVDHGDADTVRGWGRLVRVQVPEVCCHLLPGQHHTPVLPQAAQAPPAASAHPGRSAGQSFTH